MTATEHPTEAPTRPRVEGERVQEIFEAALTVLADVGYDRLTMDAVATTAKASKATLYRRWNDKAHLVVDALVHHKGPEAVDPDTGSLRADLLQIYCGSAGPLAPRQIDFFASVLTALHRDPEFGETFRRTFLAPKVAVVRAVFERARERGEIRDDVDIDLVAPAVPGIVMHRSFILGELPTRDLVERVLDKIVLPDVTVRTDPSTTTSRGTTP